MKILFIADDYVPSSKKVSAKMLHELTCQLNEFGHEVYCIVPNNYKEPDHTIIDNIRIYRFRIGRFKNTGKIQRLINELKFSSKVYKTFHKIGLNPDAIVYYSPSIFFGKSVEKIKKEFSIPSYLILRDFFPQWTIDQSIIKENSFIAKFLRYYEQKTYKAANKIGVMSPANLDWFNTYTDYSYEKCSEVLYNWVDIKATSTISESTSFRKRYGLENKVIFIYGGNIGHAQDMRNVVNLAIKSKHDIKAQFVLIGQGDEYELVRRLIKTHALNNILLIPGVSQKEYFSIQKVADVGFFSLARDHKTHNFPGKILGYVSQPLPVLGSVNVGNDLLNLINDNHAGCVSITGDISLLYNNMLKLLHNKEFRRQCSANAKKLTESHFSTKSAAKKILENLV